MRLLKLNDRGEFSLTRDFLDNIPPYAILSHTWGSADDEVTFDDIETSRGQNKPGYEKIKFCARQTRQDGLKYFWVDTCCINKPNFTELSEAITSMFAWYRNAVKSYVYLSDITVSGSESSQTQHRWEPVFRKSRWFTRGWTLQELLAPATVEFFSKEGKFLGTKKTLEAPIHEVTGIPISALHGAPLHQFSSEERLQWTAGRNTAKPEDKAYSLLGLFGVFMPLIYGEGENAFVRLKKAIDENLTSVNTHWIVARSPNASFTGRVEILQDLEFAIRNVARKTPLRTKCQIVISGMGGQGKSEVCLQLAHRLQNLFWGVFWVDVSTTGLAEQSFLKIAETINLPASTWEDARASISNLKHSWLLVLDNADDPDVDYQQYFPSGPSGVVILTSRNDECQQYATAQSLTLEGLNSKDAQDLLLKMARVPRDRRDSLEDEAGQVAVLLQSHPLALIQAGAYIARGHCTVAEYPRVFARQRQRLLEFRPAQARSRYQDVYTTFEASTLVIRTSQSEASRDALRLLPILAVFGPSQVPLSLFEAGWKGARSLLQNINNEVEDLGIITVTSWHAARIPTFINSDIDTWDSFRLMEAVNLLKAFSFVTTNVQVEGMSVSMHPLVHAWARDRQTIYEQHESWLQAGCLIACTYDDGAPWSQIGRQVQPHVVATTEWKANTMFAAEPPMMITSILLSFGWMLYYTDMMAELNTLLDKILDHLELDRYIFVPQWLEVYYLSALTLTDSGCPQMAVPLLEGIVKIREQTGRSDFPLYLAAQHGLARAYRETGRVEEAVTLLEGILKTLEQTDPAHHNGRIASQHNLASAYMQTGRLEEAVALLEGIVKTLDQSDNPQRLTSMHDLAMAYTRLGHAEQAAALLEQVVKSDEGSLIETHPGRLLSQYNLARAYWKAERFDEAETLLKQIVEFDKQSLAEDHPSRLLSKYALAIWLWALGKWRHGLDILLETVDIYRRSFKQDHPDRMAAEAGLQELMGRYVEWADAWLARHDAVRRDADRVASGNENVTEAAIV